MICSSNYCFSHVPIFQNLKRDEMDQITQMIQRQTYQRGQLILMAGESKKMLFIVRSGKVKVVRPLEDGSEQILRLVNPGDFFGDTTLFQTSPLSTTVEAIEETDICIIDGNQLKAFLEKTPTVLFKILEQLTLRLETVEDNLSAICHKEVGSRVAHYLIKQMEVQNKSTFLLSESKKDIASLLGTTRETVSRKLSEFQKRGYIEINRNFITIHQTSALRRLATI